MKRLTTLLLAVIILASCQEKSQGNDVPLEKVMAIAKQQVIQMDSYLHSQEDRLPRSYNAAEEEIITSPSTWWCSGFYPGVLWYLYEYFEDDSIKNLADKYSMRVENEKFNTYDHDIGFQMYCSFGNGYRLTDRSDYKEVLLISANSALERYNPEIGLIRSWDKHRKSWQYPVIIDNMMNLELLMWAFHETKDSTYYKVAVSHADKTLENHFRSDYSSYHVVSYDTVSGSAEFKVTAQGAFDESIWSRGQAWGLYGYTMMYRETGLSRYLNQAIGIAKMLIDHPNMTDDYIPYWDLLAEDIPEALRDASAAAIMASALIELSQMEEVEEGQKFFEVAKIQLQTLSSDTYLAEPGTNGNFILKHSVGHLPVNSEVDVPLTYADYYFVEALIRYKSVQAQNQ